MKTFVCLALVLAVAQAALDLDTEWEQFRAKFEKQYLSAEEVRRSSSVVTPPPLQKENAED